MAWTFNDYREQYYDRRKQEIVRRGERIRKVRELGGDVQNEEEYLMQREGESTSSLKKAEEEGLIDS